MIEAHGWFQDGQRGSHMRFRHPDKEHCLFVPYHASKDMKTGLYFKLLKEAGLK